MHIYYIFSRKSLRYNNKFERYYALNSFNLYLASHLHIGSLVNYQQNMSLLMGAFFFLTQIMYLDILRKKNIRFILNYFFLRMYLEYLTFSLNTLQIHKNNNL